MRKQSNKSVGNRKDRAAIGLRAFVAISAVEGLKLSPAGLKRVTGTLPIEQRRDDVIKAYRGLKGRH